MSGLGRVVNKIESAIWMGNFNELRNAIAVLNEETPGKHAKTILLCCLTLWADCKETYDKQGEALWIGLRELKSLVPWDQSLEIESERALKNRFTLEIKLNDKRPMKKEISRSKRNSERRRM